MNVRNAVLQIRNYKPNCKVVVRIYDDTQRLHHKHMDKFLDEYGDQELIDRVDSRVSEDCHGIILIVDHIPYEMTYQKAYDDLKGGDK